MDGVAITAVKSLYSLDAAVAGWYAMPSLQNLFLLYIIAFLGMKIESSLSLVHVNIKHRYYNRAIQGGLLMIKTGEEGDTRCLHDVLLLHIP